MHVSLFSWESKDVALPSDKLEWTAVQDEIRRAGLPAVVVGEVRCVAGYLYKHTIALQG
jgi:hypothetical protein